MLSIQETQYLIHYSAGSLAIANANGSAHAEAPGLALETVTAHALWCPDGPCAASNAVLLLAGTAAGQWDVVALPLLTPADGASLREGLPGLSDCDAGCTTVSALLQGTNNTLYAALQRPAQSPLLLALSLGLDNNNNNTTTTSKRVAVVGSRTRAAEWVGSAVALEWDALTESVILASAYLGGGGAAEVQRGVAALQ